MMKVCKPIVSVVMAAAITLAGALTASVPARAQSNLDAGRSPAQIFLDGCTVCHNTPHELKQSSAEFLRKHYTTGQKQAGAMAAYLEQVRSEPPPAPPVKPRVPSESMEASAPPATSSAGSIAAAAPQAAAERTIHEFEE